jgi:hypothetical protein
MAKNPFYRSGDPPRGRVSRRNERGFKRRLALMDAIDRIFEKGAVPPFKKRIRYRKCWKCGEKDKIYVKYEEDGITFVVKCNHCKKPLLES